MSPGSLSQPAALVRDREKAPVLSYIHHQRRLTVMVVPYKEKQYSVSQLGIFSYTQNYFTLGVIY